MRDVLGAQEHHAADARALPRHAAPARSRARGGSGSAARDLVERLADQGRATPRARSGNLSGGNQQKVVLAKWLDSRRRGLHLRRADPRDRRRREGGGLPRCWSSSPRAGKGVIFISSEFPELVGTATACVVMREGRLVGEFEGDAVTESALVERCYASLRRPADFPWDAVADVQVSGCTGELSESSLDSSTSREVPVRGHHSCEHVVRSTERLVVPHEGARGTRRPVRVGNVMRSRSTARRAIRVKEGGA